MAEGATMSSIPYEQLVDLAEGRLAGEAAAALRARAAADPAARSQLAALENLIGLMRSDDSVDAPDHVINRALRLMRRPAAAPQPTPLRRLVAALQRDSWRMPLAGVGLRAEQTWPRALLLSAGDRELDLQISPHGELWRLQGQILGPEEPGSIELTYAGRRLSMPINELGEFALPPLSAGRYTLTIIQGDLAIVVPELELGPSSTQG